MWFTKPWGQIWYGSTTCIILLNLHDFDWTSTSHQSLTLPMKPAWTAVIAFSGTPEARSWRFRRTCTRIRAREAANQDNEGKGLRAARFQQPGLSNNLIDRSFNLFEIDFVEETVIGKPWKPIHNAQQCLIQTVEIEPSSKLLHFGTIKFLRPSITVENSQFQHEMVIDVSFRTCT